jgi:xanthine dehydrogenase molybdenum-binding subunit
MAPNIVLSKKQYNVVGTRPIRHDGTDKVTGRAKYGGDVQMAGLLHGRILRSPHAHARIKSIDASKALALLGVKAIVTSKEFPRPSEKVIDLGEGDQVDVKFLSNNCLADDKVLYKGHAVAAVAATSIHLAEQALSLIDVDYEILSPAVTLLEAMEEGAPLLHEDLTTMELGEMTERHSNIVSHFQHTLGDLKKGFAEADVIIEREFTTNSVHQGYIEPQNATAFWNSDGKLTIWTSTQGAFSVRDATASVLGLSVSAVKVVPMEIGGGFGGKIPIYLEPVAALLSRKTGKPVKLIMSRAEVFEGTGPASGTYIKVKLGATGEGKITAAQAYLAYEAGAYPGSPVSMGAQSIFAPYNIENAQVDGYDVLVNKPKTAAYRAPGAPQAAFAAESVVDEICQKLGLDPLEFRLRNASQKGTRRIDGPIYPRIGNVECIEAAKASDHYNTPLVGPNRGRGVASGFWFNAGMQSSCSIGVNADGTISLVVGSTDIGGTRASLAMQAAEVLGIPAEDVHPSVGDTESVGYTFLTGGSRVTFATGWAAYECAQDIKQKMAERAASIWSVPIAEVVLTDGIIQHKSNPKLLLSFKELAANLNNTGGPISSQVSVDPKGAGGAFGTHIADVEVDPDTGKVEIIRYTVVQDAGKAIHPSYVEGQMQGGVAQGIGWALNEEYFFNQDGHMVNASFLDYRMPTSLDLPMVDTVIVEVANPGHPFGVRGVGEVPIVAPLAAIANAIANANGARMYHLPMSPGAVLETLWRKEERQK